MFNRLRRVTATLQIDVTRDSIATFCYAAFGEFIVVEKHFVTFVSPGTFVPETTTKEIGSWDVEQAKTMATEIVERYNATPYSFHFTTRRNDGDLDSKEVARSVNYFLGGEVLTLADIKDRNDEKDRILISSMESNGIERVVENRNSWRATLPLGEKDIVLPFSKSA